MQFHPRKEIVAEAEDESKKMSDKGRNYMKNLFFIGSEFSFEQVLSIFVRKNLKIKFFFGRPFDSAVYCPHQPTVKVFFIISEKTTWRWKLFLARGTMKGTYIISIMYYTNIYIC